MEGKAYSGGMWGLVQSPLKSVELFPLTWMGLNQTLNEERWIFKFWAKEIIPLGVAWKKHMKVRELEENKRIWKLGNSNCFSIFGGHKNRWAFSDANSPPLSRLIYSCVRNVSRTCETYLLGFFLYLCFTSKLTVTMEMTQCCLLPPRMLSNLSQAISNTWLSNFSISFNSIRSKNSPVPLVSPYGLSGLIIIQNWLFY